jgi:hypothetical protein
MASDSTECRDKPDVLSPPDTLSLIGNYGDHSKEATDRLDRGQCPREIYLLFTKEIKNVTSLTEMPMGSPELEYYHGMEWIIGKSIRTTYIEKAIDITQ